MHLINQYSNADLHNVFAYLESSPVRLLFW